MNQSTALDRQLADMVWMMITALHAGYPLRQILRQLTSESPEPTASVCARVTADLDSGLTLDQALTNSLQLVSSDYWAEIIGVIRKQSQTEGDLAALLEPVRANILKQVGTDMAFWPAMQQLAQAVKATLPQHG